jgi:queuine/archaeosine tRNA-ribosyltransferase
MKRSFVEKYGHGKGGLRSFLQLSENQLVFCDLRDLQFLYPIPGASDKPVEALPKKTRSSKPKPTTNTLIASSSGDSPKEPSTLKNTNQFVSALGLDACVKKVSPTLYREAVQMFQPDLVVSMADQVVHIAPEVNPKKRYKRATERSQSFLKVLLGEASEESSKKLKVESSDSPCKPAEGLAVECGIFAVVDGGKDAEERKLAVEGLPHDKLCGYVIPLTPLNASESEPEKLDQSLISPLKETLGCLPAENKARLVYGVSTIAQLLEAISCGADLFDSLLPYEFTQRGQALLLHYADQSDASSLQNIEMLNLYSKEYVDQFVTMDPNCDCLGCRQHTLGYIHHLWIAKEMLGQVLLMIHNMRQFQRLFASVRQAIHRDSFESLKDRICARGKPEE